MNKRLLIIIVALIAIAILFLVLPRFIFQKPETTTPPEEKEEELIFPLNEAEVGELSIQAEREFDFAILKSKEWRDDSIFYAMISRYEKEIAPENGKNTYIFFSPSLSEYYWTITIDQAKNVRGENDYERIIYFKEDYFLSEDITPIPLQYWTLSYLDALEKADELGGKDIRRIYDNYDVNILLSSREGRYLTWDVEYLVDDKSMFLISINAFNGEVS